MVKARLSLKLIALLAAGLLQACAGLQPVDTPNEFTPSPSQADKWREIEAVRPGNWFTLLNHGGEALDWRLRAMDSAVESIDLQTFIWELDTVGSQVRAHLLAAAERGVRVRVLVDDSFILDADRDLLDIDDHANIDLRVFNPYKRRSNAVVLREVLNLGDFSRLDHRMHNKVMVVDNRIAIIGGRNLASHYYGYDPAANFRDMELVAGGPVAQTLSGGFDDYWNNPWSFPVATVMAGRPALRKPRGATTAPTPAGPHVEQTQRERVRDWKRLAAKAQGGTARLLLDQPPETRPGRTGEAPVQVGEELVRAIDGAKAEIILVSAYLIPTPELTAAIESAEKRGVQVRVLTNSINSNNHLTAHSAYRRHIEQLIDMGVEVHETRADAKDRALYMESPLGDKSLCLHAKILVIDADQVFIGSANLDPRSLKLNTEMGLLIKSPVLNAKVRQVLRPDFSLRNAWSLRRDAAGQVTWVSDDRTLDRQPAYTFMRQIEDWFLALLPLEGEL